MLSRYITIVGIIMGELLVSKEGIGYLIMYGSQVFNLNLVMTGIILLALISYILYFIVCTWNDVISVLSTFYNSHLHPCILRADEI